MVLKNLVKNEAGIIHATFLRASQEKVLEIKDREHLVKRMGEYDKSECGPSQEEIEVMINNFPDIF